MHKINIFNRLFFSTCFSKLFEKSFIFINFGNFRRKKLFIFNNNSIEEAEGSFGYFIRFQILIFSSVDSIKYYFIDLLTLRIDEYEMVEINIFKFNNESLDAID